MAFNDSATAFLWSLLTGLDTSLYFSSSPVAAETSNGKMHAPAKLP
jgi:hypothetical protein